MPITPASRLVAQAKAEITTLSIDETRSILREGRARLVDIRDIRELDRAGRIDGALHAPRGMLEFWIDPQSPYHRPELATGETLVLFCAAAARSALAVKTLQDMGVENAVEMDGGFKGWAAAGHPILRD